MRVKRYKILKDFLDDKAVFHPKNDEWETDREEQAESVYFMEALKANSFIKEIPEQPKTVWDLKEDESCWAICWGTVHERVWVEKEDYVDMRAVGDIFLTKLEAEKELARRKAKQILLRDTKGYRPKKNTGHFYVICWDPYNEHLTIDYWDTDYSDGRQNSPLNFEYREDAEASIKAHPNEWKTYLGVEDE